MAKRTQNVKRAYRDQAGEWIGRKIPATVKAVRLTIGELSLTCELEELNESILAQAAAFGLNQALGNAANTNDENVSGMTSYEAAEARLERIQEGHWSTERSGFGPRTSDLCAAIAAVQEAAGREFNSVSFSAKLAEMSDDDRSEFTKKLLAKQPQVAAEVARIKAARASERAEKLSQFAEESNGEDSDLESMLV